MLSDLRTFVLADGTVAGLVALRMYPSVLPQAPTLPAITYNTISAIRQNTMDGPDGLPSKRIQIDSWGSTFAQAVSLADAIRQRLDGYRGTMGSTEIKGVFANTERQLYDPDPKLYRISMDFVIWSVEQ